jgi:hypothetical protein
MASRTMRTRRTTSHESVRNMRKRRMVGKHVAKYFKSKVHYGIVEAYEEPYWRVRYDDDDEEHFDEEELKIHLRLNEELATSGEETTSGEEATSGEESGAEDEEEVERVFPCEGDSDTEDDEEMERVFYKTRTSSIYVDKDKKVLSSYQCLLWKQMEIFEAGPDDVGSGVQGRINPVRLGQVGIRCRHCASLTKGRPSGGLYYSRNFLGLYVLAQNIAKGHLETKCKLIDARVRAKLIKLCQVRKRSSLGTKGYFVKRFRAMGIYEKDGCLRWRKT